MDTHALIAALRRGDEAAVDDIDQAYREVFGSPQGRLVLAHFASEAGVGQKYGSPAVDPYSLGYHQGGHDLAVDLINRAGFDPASTVLMTMTGHLEGRDDEQSALPDRHAEADPELPD